MPRRDRARDGKLGAREDAAVLVHDVPGRVVGRPAEEFVLAQPEELEGLRIRERDPCLAVLDDDADRDVAHEPAEARFARAQRPGGALTRVHVPDDPPPRESEEEHREQGAGDNGRDRDARLPRRPFRERSQRGVRHAPGTRRRERGLLETGGVQQLERVAHGDDADTHDDDDGDHEAAEDSLANRHVPVLLLESTGRGGRGRTADLLLPKQPRYRCATPRFR